MNKIYHLKNNNLIHLKCGKVKCLPLPKLVFSLTEMTFPPKKIQLTPLPKLHFHSETQFHYTHIQYTHTNKVTFEWLVESLMCWITCKMPLTVMFLWLHSIHLIIMFPRVDQTTWKTLWMKSISKFSIFFFSSLFVFWNMSFMKTMFHF